MLHEVKYKDRDDFECTQVGEITEGTNTSLKLDGFKIMKKNIIEITELPEYKTKKNGSNR
jgi:hypothetical protein